MTLSRYEAKKHLPGTMTMCSNDAGWTSVLLREYEDPLQTEEFVTPATDDHLIVLVTQGFCDIEVRYPSGWQKTHQRPGYIGMTAPGNAALLRWNGSSRHRTLQLHLPAATLSRARDELSDRMQLLRPLPSGVGIIDPLLEQTMLSLASAVRSAAPDLYAEVASELLAVHLLGGPQPIVSSGGEERRLKAVEEYLRANLGEPITLKGLAAEAGISRFHLLRLFKHAYGETPLRQLTRLRMERAAVLIRMNQDTITRIASLCGYENPSHFATAFRRHHGISPRGYRKTRL